MVGTKIIQNENMNSKSHDDNYIQLHWVLFYKYIYKTKNLFNLHCDSDCQIEI